MARRPPSRPGLRLGVLAIVIIALYSAMAGTGKLTPPLGLDLRGGTTVTLTPQKQAGKAPTSAVLSTAVDIIRQRVNGLGVSGADVVTQGQNVVITVPGKGRSDVLNQVGQTASLSFREIYTDPSTQQPYEAQSPAPATTPSPSTSTTPKVSTSTSAPATSPSPATSSSAASRGGSAGRAPLAPVATPTTSASPSTPVSSSTGTPGVVQSAAPAGSNATPSAPEQNQTAPTAAVLQQFQQLDCSQNGGRPTFVDTDPHHYVVACDRTQPIKYLLTPADIQGTAVNKADATIQTGTNGVSTGQWVVELVFKQSAVGTVQSVSSRLAANNMQPLAITLDGVVISAPATREALGQNIEISGGGTTGFTEKEANDLANSLKYGSLPVAFNRSTAQSISATLGKSSLHAGLLAGAIGLALVLVYVFLYYRMLGFVAVASLIVSGALVYATVTLLGAGIGYTLSLAGIAGLIVSIGITADSFVVFFERLKDEMREGRSPRLAVEYGWVRARRTIFSADTVSFLAAVILYIVSVGDVKGFAFTLGLSTVLDIVVVLLFTKPLMTLLIRFPAFSTSRASGISAGRVGVDRPARPSRRTREA